MSARGLQRAAMVRRTLLVSGLLAGSAATLALAQHAVSHPAASPDGSPAGRPNAAATVAVAGSEDSKPGVGAPAELEAGIGRPDHVRTAPTAPPLPAGLLRLPETTGVAIAVDLSQNRMFVYRSAGDAFQLIADHFVSIGKNGGFKQVEGDERTPVGIYFVTSWIPDEQLPELYGAGAFPVSYPNLWDRRLGRTGSGIWIHGMPRDQETRAPRSSRGCLSLNNRDLLGIAPTIESTRTPVLIADRLEWTDVASLRAARDEILAQVEGWRAAWEALDTDAYLAYYADDFRSGRMDKAAWSRHKRRVNSTKSFVRIALRDIGAYSYPSEPGLVLVDFRQTYRSSNYDVSSRKRQYWRRTDAGWRIVQEGSV